MKKVRVGSSRQGYLLAETASIVDASAANTIAALSAGVAIAIHIAGGSRSTHTSSASSDIIN